MEATKIILPIPEMPTVEGLNTPRDFYTLLRQPALLAGMRHPNNLPGHFPQALAQLGFVHVICLTDDNPTYPVAPLNQLGSVALEDLYGGIDPRDQVEERQKILTMANLAVERLEAGEGVIIHCGAGIGRTGTVLGAVLIQLGNDPRQVVEELSQFNQARGHRWPESGWQKELLLSL